MYGFPHTGQIGISAKTTFSSFTGRSGRSVSPCPLLPGCWPLGRLDVGSFAFPFSSLALGFSLFFPNIRCLRSRICPSSFLIVCWSIFHEEWLCHALPANTPPWILIPDILFLRWEFVERIRPTHQWLEYLSPGALVAVSFDKKNPCFFLYQIILLVSRTFFENLIKLLLTRIFTQRWWSYRMGIGHIWNRTIL